MSEDVIKCVVVGDGFVGKTSLLMRLCKKECEDDYRPTIFDNHSITTEHNGKSQELLLVDTAGQEGYKMLRVQLYEGTNVFLVCFSVANPISFSNVKEFWLPEIEEYQDAAKILIGTKSDLRNDPETIDKLNASGAIFVSTTVATNLAKSHNMQYVECSSTTQENMEQVVKTILDVHFSKRPTISEKVIHNNPCCINPVLRILRKALCCKNNY